MKNLHIQRSLDVRPLLSLRDRLALPETNIYIFIISNDYNITSYHTVPSHYIAYTTHTTPHHTIPEYITPHKITPHYTTPHMVKIIPSYLLSLSSTISTGAGNTWQALGEKIDKITKVQKLFEKLLKYHILLSLHHRQSLLQDPYHP